MKLHFISRALQLNKNSLAHLLINRTFLLCVSENEMDDDECHMIIITMTLSHRSETRYEIGNPDLRNIPAKSQKFCI